MLVAVGDGPVYQVPMTYRGMPLDGADAFLIGTTDHSVLGRRWVYDACGDPVFAADRDSEGVVRHPSFLGLRTDKKATDVRRERPQP